MHIDPINHFNHLIPQAKEYSEFSITALDDLLEADVLTDDEVIWIVQNFDRFALPTEQIRGEYLLKLVPKATEEQRDIILNHFHHFDLHDLDGILDLVFKFLDDEELLKYDIGKFNIDFLQKVGEIIECELIGDSLKRQTLRKKEVLNKLIVHQNNHLFSSFIYLNHTFHIEDRNFMISLAKDINDGRHEWIISGSSFILDHLNFFHIDDPDFILKLASETNDFHSIHYAIIKFRDLHLEIPDSLFERFLSFGSASQIASHLKFIDMSRPGIRKRVIDRVIINENGVERFFQCYEDFHLKDPNELRSLADRILNVPGQAYRMIPFLKKFQIEDDDKRKRQIITLAIRNKLSGPENILQHFKAFEFLNGTALVNGDHFIDFSKSYLSLFGLLGIEYSLKLISWLDKLNENTPNSIIKTILAIPLKGSCKLRTDLVHFIYYFFSLPALSGLPSDRIDDFYRHGFMESIFDLRDSHLRLDLVDRLVKIFNEAPHETFQRFIGTVKNDNRRKSGKYKLAARIFLTSLTLGKMKPMDDFVDKSLRFLKDGRNRVLFLNTLKKLAAAGLGSTNMTMILNYLKTLDRHSLRSELRCIAGLEALDKLKILSGCEIRDSFWFRDKLLDCLGDLLTDLELPEKERQRFVDVFVNSRMPEALPVYISTHCCSGTVEVKVVHSIKEFIQTVSDNSFHEMRYERSEHLDRIFSSQKDLKEKWKSAWKAPISDFLYETVTSKEIDFLSELKIKLDEGHLPKDQLPRLSSLIEGKSTTLPSSLYEQVDDLLCQLCSKGLSLGRRKGLLSTISRKLKQIDPASDFLNDIAGYKMSLKSISTREDGYVVVDTDDPIDLLLCGTEVAGSCQRIAGNKFFNKGLMGFVLDGKHRLLAIKGRDGTIIGRSILRLMWDKEKEIPVLFFERIYPSNLPQAYEKVLITAAKRRAADLGLPLISSKAASDLLYDGTPASLGLRDNVAYEYCDAGPGLTDAGYAIKKCYFLSGL